LRLNFSLVTSFSTAIMSLYCHGFLSIACKVSTISRVLGGSFQFSLVQALFFYFLLKSIFVIKSLLYETIYSHLIRGEGEIIYKKTVFFNIWNMKSDFSNGGQQTYMHFCSRFANIHG